jgi:hypothetical protein
VWQAVSLWAEANEMIHAEDTVYESVRRFLHHWVPLSNVRSNYFSATLNAFDFPTAIAASVYLLVVVLDESDASFFDGSNAVHLHALYAITTLLLFTRQLRILLNTSSIGPLVVMILRMVNDLFKWLAIIVLVLVGFTYAFAAFAKSAHEADDVCPEESTITIAIMLSASLFTGDTPRLCMLSWYSKKSDQREDSYSEQLPWLIGLNNAFLLLAYMLMVNLVIALFSRSFDLLSESAVSHYQLLCAQSLVNWLRQPPAPPPLLLLRLPYEAGSALVSLRSFMRILLAEYAAERRTAMDGEEATTARASGFRARATATMSATSRALVSAITSDTSDTTENDPSLHRSDMEELRSTLFTNTFEYIGAREDDSSAEERWRMMLVKSLARKMKKHNADLSKKIQRLEARIDPTGSAPAKASDGSGAIEVAGGDVSA